MIAIDWSTIRPLNGSMAEGFEELCVQLARLECPVGGRFKRKGTPDAGVECYAVVSNEAEWGWQAKYFDGFGNSQWSQLDKSVKTALNKHPRLVRYFVCIPLDRPDARISGKKSAMERWDDHVAKWSEWASDRGMAVEFVYWGSSELIERLSRPYNIGRVHFWFDVRSFDRGWFTVRLDEALKTAGPRYTPEIHVDLPIAVELQAFGRTEVFFDRIKSHARDIRKRLRELGYAESKVVEPSLGELAVAVSTKVEAVLNSLGALTVQPAGRLPFPEITAQVKEAESATTEFQGLLLNCERDLDAKRAKAKKGERLSLNRDNPFSERFQRLYALASELREVRESLMHAEDIAGSALMLLNGNAGTGKTHLLCDVAKQRIAAGRPTVLLMGQQFVSQEPPWVQVTQQLDLPGLSAVEFVGALEAAAQAANCRALVLVDAINEGAGRLIWPCYLPGFLAHLERSPWIGVLLSVRSSYEEVVVPEEIRARAASVTHHGFAEHEYDATRTFFIHYGLDLPSIPLIAPEFHNPLFLKTLCQGLNAKGERRLPRGFHGITAMFDLYLSAINQRLSSTLDFNPKHALVRQALEDFAKALVDSGVRWLSLVKAEEVINARLSGRDFERSLYHGLVDEGVLVEESVWQSDSVREDVVFISYERFADHVVVKTLLDTYLDHEAPALPFEAGGSLAFLWDESLYLPSGLLEAMCIQIPERTGYELISLAPELKKNWGIGDAFRQSLVWRDPTAFSETTKEVLNQFIQNDHDWNDTLDALLTVTTIAGHPLNAFFLDSRLRRDSMPERDAWWSTYLHKAWRSQKTVDRLVDWAGSITPDTIVDDESVELCAISLCWMLTTSNRHLRDRATKALVSLLTGRLDAVVRLVELFAELDDPYVVERVYAVAYGAAMRSYDPVRVGPLAESVYNFVFASEAPPAHILLRDYARGVVERALNLGARIDVEVERIRPPYRSTWPNIPTEEEIRPLMPDWSRGAHDSGDLEWARNRIGSSVMNDDFARYVIGTNSSSTNHDWLSVGLEEPTWVSVEEQIAELISGFSVEARSAWETFDNAEIKLSGAKFFASLPDVIADKFETAVSVVNENGVEDENSSGSIGATSSPDVAELENSREIALSALKSLISDGQVSRLEELLTVKEGGRDILPGFELIHIQRYILWRVFDLGWTTERFGQFDRFSIGYHGREASKAERIGKKYQWIAYHEIMAFISDHFQYRGPYGYCGDRSYDGPWQDGFRDIDPSCTLRALKGGTSWDGHSPAWWGAAMYDNWGDPDNSRNWALNRDDLPNVKELLRIVHPEDGSSWFNVEGSFLWKQPVPADKESSDMERRDFWYSCTGYLIRTKDSEIFIKWAGNKDLWNQRMPEPPEVYQMFLGEHGWAPASHFFQQPYYGDDGWTQAGNDCPVKIRTVTVKYLCAGSGFDCSVDESFMLRLPQSDLVEGLGIRWKGVGADYVDSSGKLAAFDPTAHAEGPSALLLREDLLREFLQREDLTICWVINGEKRVIGAGLDPRCHTTLQIVGTFVLRADGPDGVLKFKPGV